MKIEQYQIDETKKEITAMLKSGMVQVSLDYYNKMLNNFGLKLCLDKKNYLNLYYNNLNEQHFLHASTTALDSTNNSFANIYGCFYQNEIKKETSVYNEFKEFRNKYFTIYKDNYILSI